MRTRWPADVRDDESRCDDTWRQSRLSDFPKLKPDFARHRRAFLAQKCLMRYTSALAYVPEPFCLPFN